MMYWAIDKQELIHQLWRVKEGEDVREVVLDLYEHPEVVKLTVHQVTEAWNNDTG